MGRFFRLDVGALGKVERTPQGGLRIPATLTRTGVFEYASPRGTIREYRPPEEVAKADSLASLKGAPLTLDHPPARVDSKNYAAHTKGHVGDDVRMEADKVAATLYVQDAQAIRAIEAGRRELSCGYHCDTDEIPGVTPTGEPYDRIQRNIHYNHLALVDDGRAGHEVRLRLDAKGNSTTTNEGPHMKIEIIDGVEYEVGSAAHSAAKDAQRSRCDAAEKLSTEALRKATADKDAATARADAADAKLKALAEEVKEKLTPERMDAAVAARGVIVEKARALLGKEFKTDGLTNGAIKLAVVGKAFPDLKLDGKSKDYVNGLWHSITAKDTAVAKERMDAADRLIRSTLPFPNAGTGAGGDRTDANKGRTVEQAREDSLEDASMRSGRPLALSRRDKSKPLSSNAMLQSAQLETMK